MNCPYCRSEIHPKALACPHCTRDLALISPLLERMESLEKRVGALESWLGSSALIPMLGGQPRPGSEPLPSAAPMANFKQLAAAGLAVIVLLLAAHWLILFLYDAPALYLRLVSVAVPAFAALLLYRSSMIHWPSSLVAALLVALVSVFAMLGVTAWIDSVAWLPSTPRDLRETLEYSLSIFLAWTTGALAAAGLQTTSRLVASRRLALTMIQKPDGKPLSVDELSQRIQKIAAALAPIASGLGALYTGIKSLGGD